MRTFRRIVAKHDPPLRQAALRTSAAVQGSLSEGGVAGGGFLDPPPPPPPEPMQHSVDTSYNKHCKRNKN